MESFIPFGVSSRLCIGKEFSRSLLFVVIINMVQRYEMEYIENMNERNHKTNGQFGIMRRPYDYHMKITQRT